jgi:hypothetical protein
MIDPQGTARGDVVKRDRAGLEQLLAHAAADPAWPVKTLEDCLDRSEQKLLLKAQRKGTRSGSARPWWYTTACVSSSPIETRLTPS